MSAAALRFDKDLCTIMQATENCRTRKDHLTLRLWRREALNLDSTMRIDLVALDA